MMEVTSNPAAQAAIVRARQERAEAFRMVWSWLRPRRQEKLAGCAA